MDAYMNYSIEKSGKLLQCQGKVQARNELLMKLVVTFTIPLLPFLKQLWLHALGGEASMLLR
jgi:hypothetical protein